MGKDSASLAPGGADGLDFLKKNKIKNSWEFKCSIFSLFSPGLSRKQRHQPWWHDSEEDLFLLPDLLTTSCSPHPKILFVTCKSAVFGGSPGFHFRMPLRKVAFFGVLDVTETTCNNSNSLNGLPSCLGFGRFQKAVGFNPLRWPVYADMLSIDHAEFWSLLADDSRVKKQLIRQTLVCHWQLCQVVTWDFLLTWVFLVCVREDKSVAIHRASVGVLCSVPTWRAHSGHHEAPGPAALLSSVLDP